MARTPTRTWHATVIGGRVCAGHRYLISVGAAYERLPATIVLTGTTCHVFVAGRHIRRFTINPNQRSQPLQPPTITESKAPRHA